MFLSGLHSPHWCTLASWLTVHGQDLRKVLVLKGIREIVWTWGTVFCTGGFLWCDLYMLLKRFVFPYVLKSPQSEGTLLEQSVTRVESVLKKNTQTKQKINCWEPSNGWGETKDSITCPACPFSSWMTQTSMWHPSETWSAHWLEPLSCLLSPVLFGRLRAAVGGKVLTCHTVCAVEQGSAARSCRHPAMAVKAERSRLAVLCHVSACCLHGLVLRWYAWAAPVRQPQSLTGSFWINCSQNHVAQGRAHRLQQAVLALRDSLGLAMCVNVPSKSEIENPFSHC